MDTMSKFDEYKQKNEIRAKREKNLKYLEGKLERARKLEKVIPMDAKEYEDRERLSQERQFVAETIRELEEMIVDERSAIEAIDTPEYNPDKNDGFAGVSHI